MIQTFNPKELYVNAGGAVISGFASNMVSIQRDAPIARDTRGTGGEVIRWLTDNRMGTIIFSLLATGLGNAVLSTFGNLDELTGAQRFTVVIKDGAATSVELIAAPISWVQGHAQISYAKGVEIRTWTIRSSSIRILEGRI